MKMKYIKIAVAVLTSLLLMAAFVLAEDLYTVKIDKSESGAAFLVAQPKVEASTVGQFIEHSKVLFTQAPAVERLTAVLTFKYPLQVSTIATLRQGGLTISSTIKVDADGTFREEPFVESNQASAENQFPISDQIWVGAKAQGTAGELLALYSNSCIAVVDPGPIDIMASQPGCQLIMNQPVQKAYLDWVQAKLSKVTDGSPTVFALHENYPNPFNPETNIRFDLPVGAQVEAAVYNVMGQKVKTLVLGYKEAGTYNITWNGTDDSNTEVAAGVYLLRLTAGEFARTQKMLLLK
jgi:hypothetical protein